MKKGEFTQTLTVSVIDVGSVSMKKDEFNSRTFTFTVKDGGRFSLATYHLKKNCRILHEEG